MLSVLLARWSGQDDIAIGTPVAGRRHEALEGLIGFFVNTLVLRTRIDPEEDFAALLDRVRDDALEGLAHQDLPFEHLVEAMAPARDLSHAPLFQVMLALQNAPLGEMGFGGLSLSPIGFDASHAKFDITLSLQDDLTGPASDGGHRALSGTLEYATDLFDAATMARLAGQFVQLARAVADAPRQPCATLPLMSAEDRDRTIALLVEAGYTRMPVCEDAGTFAVRGGVIDQLVVLQSPGQFVHQFARPGQRARTVRGLDPARLQRVAVDAVAADQVKDQIPAARCHADKPLAFLPQHPAHVVWVDLGEVRHHEARIAP